MKKNGILELHCSSDNLNFDNFESDSLEDLGFRIYEVNLYNSANESIVMK